MRNIETVKLCFQLTQFSLNFPIKAMQFFPPKSNVLSSTWFLKFIETLYQASFLQDGRYVESVLVMNDELIMMLVDFQWL